MMTKKKLEKKKKKKKKYLYAPTLVISMMGWDGGFLYLF